MNDKEDFGAEYYKITDMKSIDELFRSKCHKHYYKDTAVIDLRKFREALTEDRQQVKNMIDEMIENEPDVNAIEALTELRSKI